MNSLKTPLITTFFVFLLLFLFTKLFGPIPFSVNSITTTKNDLLTVDGTGEATAVPDTAEFSVGVSKSANTVQQAQEQTNQAINKITEDLKRAGVDRKNIKTTNYSV